MKRSIGFSLILASLLSGSVLAEQMAKGEFYVNPGIAVMGSGAEDYKNSFSLDVAYLKAIHDIANIGWEAGYLFGSKFEGDGFTSDVNLRVLHIAPEIKVGPTFDVANLKLNVFAIGGGGFYWSHQEGGTVTTASGATATLDSHDAYNGGWNIGLGSQVALPGNWAVGLEFRRHEIVNKHRTDFTWFTPALRFALLFT